MFGQAAQLPPSRHAIPVPPTALADTTKPLKYNRLSVCHLDDMSAGRQIGEFRRIVMTCGRIAACEAQIASKNRALTPSGPILAWIFRWHRGQVPA